MNKVLIITNLLPIPEITHKKNENDILLITEDKLKEKYSGNITFKYIFIVPHTNRALAKVSLKWKSYYILEKKEKCKIRGRIIHFLGIIQLPKVTFFRTFLYDISLYLNRKSIGKLIEEYKPTVIHAQNSDVDAYVARKISEKYKIPYVVTLRGLKRSSDSVVLSNINSAQNLIAISPTQINQATKLTTKKIQLISHGIPKDFFSNPSNRPLSPEIKLVSVCRLLKLKNLDKVIKALSNLEKEYVFDIYGEGPEKKKLKLLINDLGLSNKIHLKGFVPHLQLPQILRMYNIFIMPSYPETLGRVYFEAMASGLPVIACKNTGIDGIICNGKEGFLIEPNNNNDISTVLNYTMSNPNKIKVMGENAFNLAQQYSWEQILPKIQEIYSC